MSYKIVKEEFWTDPKIKSLSIKERYLLLYFVTNPHAHLCGLYSITESIIAEETGFSASDIRKGIEELVKQKVFYFDSDFSVAWVVNMLRHQVLGWPSVSPKLIKGISNHLHKLHGCPLIKEFMDYYFEITIPYEPPRGVPRIFTPAQDDSGDSDDGDGEPSEPSVKQQAREIFEYWKQMMNHPGADYSPTRQKRIENRLRKYSAEQIRQAIDNCRKSPFHMGENDRHEVFDDIELICRNSEKLERFINMSKPEAATAPGEPVRSVDPRTGKIEQLNRKTGEWEEVDSSGGGDR